MQANRLGTLVPTFCQIPVIEPKNTLATKAPAVAPRRTAPLSSACRALFTGLFLSFYAVCSNQSDMDFLLHQRDLPGVAKRLTLADILRHEIDLRTGPNLQRVASRSTPGRLQVGRLQRSPSSNLAKTTTSAPATALAAGTSSPRNSCVSQVLAVPPVPVRPGGFRNPALPHSPCRCYCTAILPLARAALVATVSAHASAEVGLPVEHRCALGASPAIWHVPRIVPHHVRHLVWRNARLYQAMPDATSSLACQTCRRGSIMSFRQVE